MKIEKLFGSGLKMLLSRVGLEKERSKTRYILPALGLLAVGILVGGALGRLFFAPPAAPRPALPVPARDV